MTTGMDWQDAVGRTWAQMYQQTDRSFAGLTDHLLGRIGAKPGHTVLDIGCGAGELALAVARARPRAEVLGMDVSADLIAAARLRAGERSNPRFVEGDGASWSEPGFSPDLLISRHGVMFFADPPKAFAHLRDMATPQAQMVFSCFRAARENAWAAEMAEIVGMPPGDPLAPGPFAFADPQRVEALLTEGGWGRIDFEPFDFAYIAGKGEDPVEDAFAFFSRIGPAAPVLRERKGDERAALEERLRTVLETHRDGDMVVFAAAAWIVTAHADRRFRKR